MALDKLGNQLGILECKNGARNKCVFAPSSFFVADLKKKKLHNYLRKISEVINI